MNRLYKPIKDKLDGVVYAFNTQVNGDARAQNKVLENQNHYYDEKKFHYNPNSQDKDFATGETSELNMKVNSNPEDFWAD